MDSPATPPGKGTNNASPILFIIIAIVIAAAILAFIIVRPKPNSAIPSDRPNSTIASAQMEKGRLAGVGPNLVN